MPLRSALLPCGGAALGAAAASTYPYYGATCGYYPYPPCY